MFFHRIRSAEVIDCNDPDKKGRIRVRIYPEMKDIDDVSLLPYIPPLFEIESNKSYRIPEVGDFINVLLLDDYLIEMRYLPNMLDFTEENKESLFNNVKTSDVGNNSYPQPKIFDIYKDGSFYYRNTDTGEMGIVHSSGSIIQILANGDLQLKSKDNYIKLKRDNEVTIKAGDNFIKMTPTGKFEIKNSIGSLKDILGKIISCVKSLATPANLVGNLGAPVIFTMVGSELPNIIEAEVKFNSLFE